jgi:hypothetical protein
MCPLYESRIEVEKGGKEFHHRLIGRCIEAAFTQLQQAMEVEINKQMQETRQQLLDNFDEVIHNLLKIQLNQAEQRLDKITHWFWALIQYQLRTYANLITGIIIFICNKMSSMKRHWVIIN